MKTELAKVLIASSLGLATASCSSDGKDGAQGASGTIPLNTLNIDVSVVCFSGPPYPPPNPNCNVKNNENKPIFCSVSAVDLVSTTSPIYNNNLINPGDTLSTQLPVLTSVQLCDVLCWNDTGMINKTTQKTC